MKDILVVAKLKEGKFEKFMDFMQSEQGIKERKTYQIFKELWMINKTL